MKVLKAWAESMVEAMWTVILCGWVVLATLCFDERGGEINMVRVLANAVVGAAIILRIWKGR